MSSLEETKYILKKYNIKANKRLGQNFLINDNAIQEIVNAAGISAEDLIIEIGPGLGTLTSKLLEKAGKVIAVELDENMIKILKDRFKLYENFILINEDILKIDLKKLIEENLNDLRNVKIVANLPYYITTPIIMKLLEDRLNINSITVNKISVILTAISFFVIPLLFAHKSNKRGIILGLKLSLSFVLLLILINIIFFKSPFNIDRLIYYLILIISGILGGSIGKNIKLKRK